MTNKPHRVGARRARRKEAFHVRVELPDGDTTFVPATDHIGNKMPVENPIETAAMRVYPDVACFSVMHPTNKRRKEMRDSIVEMPHGPLARLARRAKVLGPHLTGNLLLIERGSSLAALEIERDASGLITLSAAEMPKMPSLAHDLVPDAEGKLPAIEGPDGELIPALLAADPDDTFERDPRGERLSLFFHSPIANRTVAVGFAGHFGRPGGADTLTRVASMVLNAIIALPEFAFLVDANSVHVPSLPSSTQRPIAVQLRSAHHVLPVTLFTEVPAAGVAPTEVAKGEVKVSFDLTHIGATASKLLYTFTPDEALAEHWEAYEPTVARWMEAKLPVVLDGDREAIIGAVVMGMVDDEIIARLDACLNKLPAVRFTPTQVDEHDRV